MDYRAKVLSCADLFVSIISFNCIVVRIALFAKEMFMFMHCYLGSIQTAKIFNPCIMIIEI